MITYRDLRQKFLDFFQSKGHAVISSASLIPENDPTVLFTTAGMHPLVPYLLGEKHPEGSRLTNAQKCLRTDDIDEVGDKWHLTFFEMLGNWSFGYEGGEVKESGSYWKKEAIKWSWEFLTDKKWLGLDPRRIYVSVFAGDKDAPRDEEAIQVWQEVFIKAGIEAKVGAGERIGLYGRAKNWWGPVGQTGPCGPDTEMFYDTGEEHNFAFGSVCHQNCDCGRFSEIWNNVFMQYAKTFDGDYIPMTFKNIDTGMGLERVLAILNGKQSVFETEIFLPIIRKIEELSAKNYTQDVETTRAIRVIADHLRAATFILGDENGVAPSNIGQGYILRRLIRRAARFGYQLGIKQAFMGVIAEKAIEIYKEFYPELVKNRETILRELPLEEQKFSQNIANSLKKIEVVARKIHRLENILTQFRDGDIDDDDDRAFLRALLKENWISHSDLLRRLSDTKDILEIRKLVEGFAADFKIAGRFIFDLYTQDGFPPEMILEVLRAVEKPPIAYATVSLPLELDMSGFQEEFKKHQGVSRAAAEQKFYGGLADQSGQVTKLHTATHLLHAALRQILGENVFQKGSNITAERLRFDFNYPEKMTVEQIQQVERLVNQVIEEDWLIDCEEMTVEEAKNKGALGLFAAKYGEKVKVYTVGGAIKPLFSREICNGPHAGRTSELGHFKIIKEESVSAGVRRIKAILG